MSDIGFVEIACTEKCENVHICVLDILPIWHNLLRIEFGPSKILYNSMFSNLRLRWDFTTDQKFYCKSDDPFGVFKSILNYVCFKRKHWPPSAWVREPQIIHTYIYNVPPLPLSYKYQQCKRYNWFFILTFFVLVTKH